MFAYCGNNPVNSSDPSGMCSFITVLEDIINFLTDVLAISNSKSTWKSESQIAARKLAKRNERFSRQVDAETSTFSNVWETAKESKVLIQMHGKPNSLQGDGFLFDVSDAELLNRNDNISFVLMTSCSSGGNNGDLPNMGQILSTKINPSGFLICSTERVSGNSSGYTAADGGKWIVYQNGRKVATLPENTVTMENVQSQLFFAIFFGGN